MKAYQENIKKYEAQTAKLKKALNRISLLRVAIFVVAAVILITLLGRGLFTPIFIVFPISVFIFGIVLKHHNKTAFLKKHTEFLRGINVSEIQRGRCILEEFDTGETFVNQNHPYTSDLDIFGQHSIFQLLNRTTTESGTMLLSKWLKQPASNHEILNRQQAIKEIAPRLDWRQDFQASGMHFLNIKSDYNKLINWVNEPTVLLKHRRIYIVLAIVLSILSLLGLYYTALNIATSTWYLYLLLFTVVIFINSRIIKKVKPLAEAIVETSEENINTLRGYRILIKKIEGERFDSDKLIGLQSILTKEKYSAYKEINKLCRLLDFSQQRGVQKIKMPIKGNAFYSLLNSFLLLDIYLIIGTERWKSKNKALLNVWSEVVSEFEAINSLSGFCYSNPSFAFPEITDKNDYVHFDMLGHPLLNSDKRVCNNFHSEGQGNIVMITGSNMGGKSTFLRAVGVNIALALAGAPCCAKYAQVSNLKIYTSMRTQDNLKKGISSFYAELDRIEKMLKLIESSTNVFFLLDEMFKGTNSEDRHKGGFSLIHQVSKLNSSGIIATHDIELAKLSEKRRLVSNYSFNSEIRNGSMIFSYELHSGICNDFNASELMERSGIKIISEDLEE